MGKKQRNYDDSLYKTYYNPKHRAGFVGKSKLSKSHSKIPEKHISKWLSQSDTYTLHKPVKKRFQRRKFVVSGPEILWQLDLGDMSNLSRHNNGYKYILLQIDVFTRKANAKLLKTKMGSEVAKVFETMINETYAPMQLHTDRGGEFFNSHFKKVTKKHKIKHYTTENQEIKASLVERLQRTIKSKIYRYFTHANTFKYTDILDDIVSSYNDSPHSTIGLAPNNVTSTNQEELWHSVYNPDNRQPPRVSFKFKVNDKVRISKYSTVFKKGYLPGWSEEIFTISQCHNTNPSVYSLKDDSGSQLEGTWHEPELQKVEIENRAYKIEAILGKRKVGGKIQYLVKWQGYPSEFNSYVNKREIINNYKN